MHPKCSVQTTLNARNLRYFTKIVLRREDEYVGKRVMAMEGKEGEEVQSGGGWITSGTTCRRENCQGRTRKTGINGGVS